MAANPDQVASQKPTLREKYDNYIGGEWVAPVDGGYFEDTTPIDGSVLAKISQSNEKDVDLAVKAAWKAAETWNKTSVTERSNILLKIADRIEENIDMLAKIETWGNGKPIRET
ncbi:MAG TPA: aldehyde dehydrogenase, partial [Gammaproteobacteria bacterium]|nr:aldehyde dehydrogenase [Gammaproteobacteria bacterium]